MAAHGQAACETKGACADIFNRSKRIAGSPPIALQRHNMNYTITGFARVLASDLEGICTRHGMTYKAELTRKVVLHFSPQLDDVDPGTACQADISSLKNFTEHVHNTLGWALLCQSKVSGDTQSVEYSTHRVTREDMKRYTNHGSGAICNIILCADRVKVLYNHESYSQNSLRHLKVTNPQLFIPKTMDAKWMESVHVGVARRSHTCGKR